MCYLHVPECELVTLDNTRVSEVLEPGWGKPTKNAAIILTQAPPPPDHIWGQSCYSISAEYKVSVAVRGRYVECNDPLMPPEKATSNIMVPTLTGW